eukprot:TRINITY_DN91816_c0_g1_i1.p1 TRINITY_DN91816_c0_g1~~TRINITY_DN91816_c0_g1_i1.p1  ORF type:complete len:478 (+),score=96.82 TRINITY_DN91816_c0_g1_i1:223-1656(+)
MLANAPSAPKLCSHAHVGSVHVQRRKKSIVALEKSRGLKLDVESFNVDAITYARHGKWKHAVNVVNDFLGYGITLRGEPKLFGAAVAACDRSGRRWMQALHILRGMAHLSFKKNAVVYNAAASACADRGGRCIRKLLAAMSLDVVEVDGVTYGVLLSSLSKAADDDTDASLWKSAIASLEDMLMLGLEVGTIACSAAGDVCEACAQWPTAIHLLGFMGSRRTEPNAVTCSTVLSACHKGEAWKAASALLVAVHEVAVLVDVVMSNAMMSAYAVVQLWYQAVDNLQLLQKAFLQPTPFTYNTLLSAFGQGGHWSFAHTVCQFGATQGVASDIVTLGALLNTCETSGAWLRVHSILQTALHGNVRVSSFVSSAALNTCAQAGQAWQTMYLMNSFSCCGLESDELTYSALVFSFQQRQSWNSALHLLRGMTTASTPADPAVYNSVIKACESTGNTAKVLDAMYDMAMMALTEEVAEVSTT